MGKKNIAPEGISYNEMNVLASKAPIGSAGISILPFGNGAERMLNNKEIGCSIRGVDFNAHGKHHIIRAAQEGIVFSLNTVSTSWNNGNSGQKDSCRTCKYVP